MTDRLTCPICDARIRDINVREGEALCRTCGRRHRLSDLANADRREEPAESVSQRSGCRVHHDRRGTTIRATLRSVDRFGEALLLCLFVNGVLSVFYLVGIIGTIDRITGAAPAWFIFSDMPLFMLVCMWIIMTLSAPMAVWGFLAVLAPLLGHVEVRIRGDRGQMRYGMGPFVLRRRFAVSEVATVRTGDGTKGERGILVIIREGRELRIGRYLTDDRRAWLAAELRNALLS